MELIAAAIVAGVVFAGVVLWVIWRATGAAFDWVIETFGNESSAERVRRKRRRA